MSEKEVQDRLDALSMPVPECGCHIWLGCCQRWMGRDGGTGYGRVRMAGRTVMAHRAAWECRHGPIPSGMMVLHKCDTPICINPDHLFLGTQSENMLDMVRKRRVDCRGAGNGRAKLTESDVRHIRASSLPNRAIARVYGVSDSAIKSIRKRKVWTHVA